MRNGFVPLCSCPGEWGGVLRTNFYQTGELVAFPSLEYLEIFGNMSAKTAQRVIDDMEAIGLLNTRRRYNQSSLHHLTIPPEAEQNYREREEMLRELRERRERGLPECPPNLQPPPS